MSTALHESLFPERGAGGAPASPGRLPAVRRPTAAWLSWLVSVGLLLIGSWRPAWSGDEAATVLVVRRSYPEVLRTAWFDPALEPYYLALKVWSAPSTSSFWLRLPSVLAMAGAVTVLWLFLSRVTDRRTAAWGAAALLVLPATSRYAHEARPYAFAVLLAVLTVHLWSAASAGRRTRTAAALALCVVLLGLSHAYALLLVPVLLVVTVAAPEGRRERLRRTGVPAGAALLVLTPYLVFVRGRAAGQPDPPDVTPLNVLEEFLRLPVGVLSPPLAVAFALLVVGLALLGTGWAALAGPAPRRHLALLAALWTAAPPLVLTLLQALTGAPGLVTRYWLFALPGLVLGTALLVPRLVRLHAAAPAAVLLVLALLALPTHVAVRGVDGHLGQRWQLLPAVLEVPGLATAPLLVDGWNYRGLVATAPAAVARMPLVVDPTPSGRVNPRRVPAGSDVMAHYDVLLVYEGSGVVKDVPTRRSFRAFDDELRTYPDLRVACAYFGDALGVFASPGADAGPVADAELAARIQGLSPRHIRCRAGAP